MSSPNAQVCLQSLGGLGVSGCALSRRKALLILCYLSLEGAKSREHLAELFWPGATSPQANLASELSHLRRCRAVGDAPGGRVYTTISSDVDLFLAALRSGDHEAALAHYRGAFLEGIHVDGSAALEAWLYATRDTLSAQACGVYLDLGELSARAGDLTAAAIYAEGAVAVATSWSLDHLRRAHTLLLAADHPVAKRLELGASEVVLTLLPTAAAARARLRLPLGIPSSGTTFFGREDELKTALASLESGCRVLALTGPAGIGKTRLAFELARSFAARHASTSECLRLGPGDTPATLALLIQAVLDTAPLRPQSAPVHKVLLVLDGFTPGREAEALLEVFTRKRLDLRLLVTSQDPLLGEHAALHLAGLAVDGGAGDSPAKRLFLERARQCRPGFVPSEPTSAVIGEICRWAKGSPGKIERAASLVTALPCEEIAEHLGVRRPPPRLRQPERAG